MALSSSASDPAVRAHLAAYEAAMAAKRRQTLIVGLVVLGCVLLAGWIAEVDLGRFGENIGRFFGYFDRILNLEGGGRVWTDPADWFWGWRGWLSLLLDTLLIAYLGTAIGAFVAFMLCFAASANLMPDPWVRGAVRRFLEFCRTVPELVFALIFVVAFGLGAVPGVLAIAIHTAGALGKLFAEVVENIDMKPVEGMTATGASWPVMVRFAAVPQVLSNFLSYGLLRFEVNVRGASILGFVGAGGIGQELIVAIRQFHYSDVSAILIMIIATVMLIDLLSERLRHRLLSTERT